MMHLAALHALLLDMITRPVRITPHAELVHLSKVWRENSLKVIGGGEVSNGFLHSWWCRSHLFLFSFFWHTLLCRDLWIFDLCLVRLTSTTFRVRGLRCAASVESNQRQTFLNVKRQRFTRTPRRMRRMLQARRLKGGVPP